ncbi:hypothetical protein Tco_1123776 [Tanacetum coccineum]|uniref:Uncharacterized protein n=1 Tax=Tanacetum coccineum TaxID=301880 RepID=A0ABQ5J4A2_9ASTR
MTPLPHHNLRHPWIRYQVDGYDVDGMRQTLRDRLSMVYDRDDGQALFTIHAWRRLFKVRRPLVREFILEFLSTCRMSYTEMGLDVEEMAEARDFLGPAPSYIHIRDPVRRLCHMMIACSISGRGHEAKKVTWVDLFYLRIMDHGTANVPHLLAQYLFRHAEGRKSRARLSKGHFIGRLAAHFGLVSDEGLRGLSVVVNELLVIDLHELARLNICSRATEDAPTAEEGAQAVPAPVLEEEVREMRQSVVGLRGVVEISITKQNKVSTWMISCMTQLMDASGRTYQAFDSTLIGSSRLSYYRRIRPRTNDADTSTAPHTDDQPDP